MNTLHILQKPIELYPVEVLDMTENTGFFKMYEKYRKMYNASSYTNKQIYEQVEELYAYYFLRYRYSGFDSFKTQYARYSKAKKQKQETLTKVKL